MTAPEEFTDVEDPLQLFWLATAEIERHQEYVDHLAEMRSRAIAALYASGYSYRDLARELGVSAPRANQLVSGNHVEVLEVLNAWAAIEKHIAYLVEALTGETTKSPSVPVAPGLLGDVLRHFPWLDEEALRDLNEIRDFRNRLVHGVADVDVEQADVIADKAIRLNALLSLAASDARKMKGVRSISTKLYEDRVNRLSRQLSDLLKKEAEAHSRAAKLSSEAQRARAGIARTTSQTQRASKERTAQRKEKDSAEWRKRASSLRGSATRKETELVKARQALERERATIEKKEESKAKKSRKEEAANNREMERIQRNITQEAKRQAQYARSLTVNQLKALPEEITVLFFSANPNDMPSLALDEEVREITQKIRLSAHRDSVDLRTVWATRPLDIMQAINEHQPHVIHISGHGTNAEEIVFDDGHGRSKTVSKEAMAEMLAATADNLRVVIFNACYSRKQAQAVAESVEAAIGMNASISDDAARTFAAQFYSAVGFGNSVERSFKQARAALMAEGLPEENIPELFVNQAFNGDEIVLVRPHV